MKLYIKSSSDASYLYIFKHGIGPGTIPRDIEVIRTKDLPNGYTAVWLNRFLTYDELKHYDIPSETRINELLDRIGYCQKNGDVVPCDNVDACDKVAASSNISSYNKYADALADHGYRKRKFIQALKEEYTEQGLNDLLDNEADLHAYITGFILNSDGRYDYKAQEKASKLASEIISEADNVDACDRVNACGDTKYFANMVSASIDDSDDDKFLVEGYYDNQRQGLAESAETSDVSYLNELINEYANKGYYIAVHNLTDGTITEFSADNWFDDLARDGGAMLFMS